MLLNGDSTLLIVLPTVFIVVLAPVITISLVHVRYKKFVERWSVGLKTLKKINDSYRFKPVSNLNMYHSYDNENMFRDISCTDYLTYQLVYEQGKVLQRIKEANRNKILFERYSEEIARDLSFGVYSTEKALMMKNI